MVLETNNMISAYAYMFKRNKNFHASLYRRIISNTLAISFRGLATKQFSIERSMSPKFFV